VTIGLFSFEFDAVFANWPAPRRSRNLAAKIATKPEAVGTVANIARPGWVKALIDMKPAGHSG
jgi:hypothetical protein